MNVWRESNRVSSSYLLLFIICLVHPCPLFCPHIHCCFFRNFLSDDGDGDSTVFFTNDDDG